LSGFVVDASVAIKWLVDEPGADIVTTLLDCALAAPDLLGPECASVLWKKVTRGELSGLEAEPWRLPWREPTLHCIRRDRSGGRRSPPPSCSGSRPMIASICAWRRRLPGRSSLPTGGW
jgi:hypothetical protein